jgi:hypothetical protein
VDAGSDGGDEAGSAAGSGSVEKLGHFVDILVKLATSCCLVRL